VCHSLPVDLASWRSWVDMPAVRLMRRGCSVSAMSSGSIGSRVATRLGKPIVMLHGGPGGVPNAGLPRFVDPDAYRPRTPPWSKVQRGFGIRASRSRHGRTLRRLPRRGDTARRCPVADRCDVEHRNSDGGDARSVIAAKLPLRDNNLVRVTLFLAQSPS
jgi:hypothetical protein